MAEMSILARIKNDHSTESSETVMEKYLETRRELETLRQRVGSEYEDEIERLESAKRNLEKRVSGGHPLTHIHTLTNSHAHSHTHTAGRC